MKTIRTVHNGDAADHGAADHGAADEGDATRAQEEAGSAKGAVAQKVTGKLLCHALGSRLNYIPNKEASLTEQNTESLLTMARVTGRKSEVKKLTHELVEHAAIGMAKRAYVATYCHITGDIHSELTKQKLPGMIA